MTASPPRLFFSFFGSVRSKEKTETCTHPVRHCRGVNKVWWEERHREREPSAEGKQMTNGTSVCLPLFAFPSFSFFLSLTLSVSHKQSPITRYFFTFLTHHSPTCISTNKHLIHTTHNTHPRTNSHMAHLIDPCLRATKIVHGIRRGIDGLSPLSGLVPELRILIQEQKNVLTSLKRTAFEKEEGTYAGRIVEVIKSTCNSGYQRY